MKMRLIVGDDVESTKEYDRIFKTHIPKTKIKEIIPKHDTGDECTPHHDYYVATLMNGKIINLNWLKRITDQE